MTTQRKRIPCSHLVSHDIKIARESVEGQRDQVVATVECERRGATLRVEECVACERFAHIETHEAGYVLHCRPHDSEIPPSDEEAAEVESADTDPALIASER
jgi:hypothetical protein